MLFGCLSRQLDFVRVLFYYACMPFDTPEQALLFNIKIAIQSFEYAPPRKNQTAAMSDWKEPLAKYVFEHLQRAQWEFRQKESRLVGPSPAHMPLRKD